MLVVREVFATLQGEGSRAGTPAVFVRFTGCNLWSGLAKHRGKGRGQCSSWCDTEFATGDAIDPAALAQRVVDVAGGMQRPFAVLTGGEPLLQLVRDDGMEFMRKLRSFGFALAVETNGTIRIPDDVAGLLDHITVSPKPLLTDGRASGDIAHVAQRSGTDLKVICPSPFVDDDLVSLGGGFTNHYFQPMDTGDVGRSTLGVAMERARRLGWSVSVQTHKLVGLP